MIEDVMRGVAWLDEQRPGWEDKIDLDRLRLGSCLDCVIGQLFGDYEALRDNFIMDIETRRKLGFTIHSWNDEKWNELTETWKQVIRNRREINEQQRVLNQQQTKSSDTIKTN